MSVDACLKLLGCMFVAQRDWLAANLKSWQCFSFCLGGRGTKVLDRSWQCFVILGGRGAKYLEISGHALKPPPPCHALHRCFDRSIWQQRGGGGDSGGNVQLERPQSGHVRGLVRGANAAVPDLGGGRRYGERLPHRKGGSVAGGNGPRVLHGSGESPFARYPVRPSVALCLPYI